MKVTTNEKYCYYYNGPRFEYDVEFSADAEIHFGVGLGVYELSSFEIVWFDKDPDCNIYPHNSDINKNNKIQMISTKIHI